MTSLPVRALSALGVASGAMLILAGNASAFTFTTNLGPGSSPPKGNVFLKSVQIGGDTVSDFTLVSGAKIISNTPVVAGDVSSGGASADRGDLATDGVVKNDLQPNASSDAAVATNLGNLNLNSIVDTEDKGSFVIDLSFQKAVDTLLFWERGINSLLQIQALADDGTLLGSALTLGSASYSFTDAGFSIDTTEVDKAQRVGSVGITAQDLGVGGPFSKIRLISLGSSFNGPDFKVVGVTEKVPEPGMMLGLGLVGSAFFVKRYRKA